MAFGAKKTILAQRLLEILKRRITVDVPIERTGFRMMTDLPRLIDAISEVFTLGLNGGPFVPKDGVTHCNEAVNLVSKRMGYSKFDQPQTGNVYGALLANDICDILSGPDWHSVTIQAAQFHANQGALVIAGWKNPEGHGHVCVVRPGLAEYSMSWGQMVPKVMNIGETNFIDKRASFAFSKDHIPIFVALKSMI